MRYLAWFAIGVVVGMWATFRFVKRSRDKDQLTRGEIDLKQAHDRDIVYLAETENESFLIRPN